MALERAQVEHIAALARIGLSEAELDTFTRQLSDILEQIAALNELDTDGVEPTAHAGELSGMLREDVAADSLSPEQTLSNAPRRQDDFFRVRAVLEE